MIKLSSNKLADTEYSYYAVPEYTTDTPYGQFVSVPEFKDRYDFNQLFNCRCQPGQVEELLAELEKLYAPTGVSYRKIIGHDPDTFNVLEHELTKRGWIDEREWMLVHDRKPERPINLDVKIEEMNAMGGEGREKEMMQAMPGLERAPYHKNSDKYLGGKLVFAVMDGKLVGTTGWYIVNSIARFRYVTTIEEARKRGVAGTMTQYIQQHPEVKAQEALCIFCSEDGPLRLYEELGFTKHLFMYAFRVGE